MVGGSLGKPRGSALQVMSENEAGRMIYEARLKAQRGFPSIDEIAVL
jgi:hypothetical protein